MSNIHDHTESTVKVYQTNDYARFRMINGNRELNSAKIKRIKSDIAGGLDVLKYCPVLVAASNNHYDILDGQHRFWVSKELRRPVHYIIADKIGLHGIAKINSNTEKWKNYDYLHCYIQQGIKDYEILRDFIEKYDITFSIGTRLLSYGSLSSDGGYCGIKEFQNGNFKAVFCKEAANAIEACKLFDFLPFWKDRNFIIAICKIINGKGDCDFSKLIDKVKDDADELTKGMNYKQYLTALENIYNKGAHTRKVIY